MRLPFQTARLMAAERNSRESLDFEFFIIINHAVQTIVIRLNLNMKNWQQKYKKLQQLGQGSSGLIFKVLSKQTNEILAAKIISANSQQSQLQAIELQVKIMTTCAHPNIIKCLGVQLFQEEVWILMEYCPEGSLADIMRNRKEVFKENNISQIMGQVLEGLEFLHQRNIVHRDIKASNLLMKDGVVKIADFGVSLQTLGKFAEAKLSRIGSPFWMSPEILSHSLYTQKADIWALGITAIELAQGVPPYSHQHPFRAIYSIQTHPPQGLQRPQNFSAQFTSFIKQCLIIDHKARPSASSLISHSFINQKIVFTPSYSSSSSSLENCAEMQDNSKQNTIILHDQLPRSIWQKDSFPQTEEKMLQKSPQCEDTVVINDNVQSNLLLFSEMKDSLQPQILNSYSKSYLQQRQKQNVMSNQEVNQSVNAKQKKVQELYRLMEEEVRIVRKKYMAMIRQVYLPQKAIKQCKEWNSPVKKLKDKGNYIRSSEHCRFSSDFLKKML